MNARSVVKGQELENFGHFKKMSNILEMILLMDWLHSFIQETMAG